MPTLPIKVAASPEAGQLRLTSADGSIGYKLEGCYGTAMEKLPSGDEDIYLSSREKIEANRRTILQVIIQGRWTSIFKVCTCAGKPFTCDACELDKTSPNWGTGKLEEDDHD